MRVCPNCGSANAANYCPQCGQRFHAAHSMREFVKQVADDQFGVDSKLPRTLKALFFKPGFLTREYMDGRIVRYIPPLRLYLIASVLFFVLLSFLSRTSDWAERAAQELEQAKDTLAAATDTDPDSVRSRGLNIGFSVGDDKWLDSIQSNTGWEWFDQKVKRNVTNLSKLPPDVAMRRISEAILGELPKVMFLMLPVFALLLKLLYIRRQRYYVEHFVFALHVHAFVFTLFMLPLVLRWNWLVSVVMVVFALYTLLAMKRVYQQGYIKTIAKWLTLSFSYWLVLVFGLLIAIIGALAGPT